MNDLNHSDFKAEYVVRTLNNKDRFKRNCLGLAFCIGISLGCANPALAGSKHDEHENEGPDGSTYMVHVKSSFGTEFDDCFTFDVNSPGTLMVQSLLGQVLTYAHDDLNMDEEDWQSTSMGNDAFGIAFHGETHRHGEKIRGDAVSDVGNTFKFKGKKTDTCNVDNGGINPYIHQ